MRQLNKALKNYRHTQEGDNLITRLQVSSSNARLLVNQKGEPVFLLGDAPWSMATQLTNAEIETYLQNRKEIGFNSIMFEAIENYYSVNAPNNIDNVPPFTGTPFLTPNDTYFQRVDFIMQRAWELGFYVFFAPLYYGYPGFDDGWSDETDAASTADIEDWGEWVATRYKKFDNLIWQLGGDQPGSLRLTKTNALATGIRNIDTTHIMTFHDVRDTHGSDDLAGATWLTLDNSYTSYLNLSTLSYEVYNFTPIRPAWNIEAHYENEHSMTTQGLRAQAYWSIAAGMIGHTFGNNPIWHFGFLGGDWEAALNDPGCLAMGYVKTFVDSIDWETLIPDQTHTMLTSGFGTIDTADYAGSARAFDGTLGIIYMPSNRTMAVNMAKFGSTVTARWYDPTNGSYTADVASPLTNSGSHNFSRATTNSDGDADWALVLTSAYHPFGVGPWAWLDFSDASKQFTTNVGSTNVSADGDRVGRIEDKSGGAHNFTQSVNNNRGTYKLNIKNSLAACSFAPDDLVDSLDNLTSLSTTDMTVVVAFKTPATFAATNYGIFSMYTSASGGNGSRITISGTTSEIEYLTTPSTGGTISISIAANTFYIAAYTVRPSGTTRTAWLNTTKSTNSTAVSASSQTLTIGRQHINNNNAYFTGHILEVFHFNGAIPDSETDKVIAWLNTKWAIF